MYGNAEGSHLWCSFIWYGLDKTTHEVSTDDTIEYMN